MELRRSGATSPEQLATRLGASRTGVLQQLRSLQAAGLVDRRTVRHGVGRPRHLYDVTPDAQVAFPSNYDGLAAGLMAAMGMVGGDDLVAEVFDARRRLIAQQMKDRLRERLPENAPLEDRVRELAVIQDEQGYLSTAVIGADGMIRLQQCNCAIFAIASALDVAVRGGAGAVPGGPRRRGRSRDAHRLRRPELHVSDHRGSATAP